MTGDTAAYFGEWFKMGQVEVLNIQKKSEMTFLELKYLYSGDKKKLL